MSQENRNICDVIERVKALIPKDAYVSMFNALERIQLEAVYQHPERQRVFWIETTTLLTADLPSPYGGESPEWVKQVGRIMRGEE